MKIHLLEPFRSALIKEAVNEKLLTLSHPEFFDQNPAFKTAGTRKNIEKALQLAVLAEELSIVWSDTNEDMKKSGWAYLERSGIESTGVVSLVDATNRMDEKIKSLNKNYKNVKDTSEMWKVFSEEIERYKHFILSQLMSRGKGVPKDFFNFYKAFMLQDDILMEKFYDEMTDINKKIFSEFILDSTRIAVLNISTFTSLSEIITSEDICLRDGRKIACGPVGDFYEKEVSIETEQIYRVYSVVLGALMEDDICFPTPLNFREVIKLRNKTEIVDLRTFINTMFSSLSSGNIDEVKFVRKKTRKLLKSFKWHKRMKSISWLTGLVSLPLGFLPGPGGLAGLGLGICSLGCSSIAENWEKNSRWLYLFEQNK